MKKQLLSICLVLTSVIVFGQSDNCAKIKQLAAEARKGGLSAEVTGDKFKTADDFDAWTAATTLTGAIKCYVQDAKVSKMYVAEFGKSDQMKTADPALSKKADDLMNMLKNCVGTDFMARTITPSENIFKGIQYDGRGANVNTKITVMLIYNPGDKKQLLFVSIINDPD